MPQLIIGTAQWGLDYGITNSQGQLSDQVIRGLVERSLDVGIVNLDTAASYGSAETRIASLVPQDFSIQTKVSGKDAHQLGERLSESLTRLGREKVHCLLIHDWFALSIQDKEITAQQLLKVQQEGRVSDIGISAYTFEDLSESLNLLPKNITVQIPLNPLDQRFIGANFDFPDVKFQARSLFLQGLLIEPTGQFSAHADLLRFQQFAQSLNMSPLEAALTFAAQQSWLDSMVIAPTTVLELDQIIQYLNPERMSRQVIDFGNCASEDLHLVDPRTWN